jgi:hypothetical protein
MVYRSSCSALESEDMATFQLPLDSPAIHTNSTTFSERTSGQRSQSVNQWPKANNGPTALIMFAYFLGLASIAVVIVGGQFPWFTVAPCTILLMVAYFRHLEATYQRESGQKSR